MNNYYGIGFTLNTSNLRLNTFQSPNNQTLITNERTSTDAIQNFDPNTENFVTESLGEYEFVEDVNNFFVSDGGVEIEIINEPTRTEKLIEDFTEDEIKSATAEPALMTRARALEYAANSGLNLNEIQELGLMNVYEDSELMRTWERPEKEKSNQIGIFAIIATILTFLL